MAAVGAHAVMVSLRVFVLRAVKGFPCLLRRYNLETSAPGTPRNLYRYIKEENSKSQLWILTTHIHTFPCLPRCSTSSEPQTPSALGPCFQARPTSQDTWILRFQSGTVGSQQTIKIATITENLVIVYSQSFQEN